MDKRERNRLVILAALRKVSSPLSSARRVERLAAAGHPLSERAVRLYLNELDATGLLWDGRRQYFGRCPRDSGDWAR